MSQILLDAYERSNPVDSPTAWFAALERARLTCDRALEAKAHEQLRRLGVHVAFLPGHLFRCQFSPAGDVAG